MGVEGAEGAGLGLHARGRGLPAAVERGQYVHGVVPGVEEDPAPQVGDAVRVAFRDADEAAALADTGQVLFADAVLDAAGKDREDGQREQCLQGAGGWEFAVGVVGGEDLAGVGVRDEPGEGGDVRDVGGAGVWPDLGVGVVQECGGRCRCAGIRPGVGSRRGGGEREDARQAEGAGRHSDPGRESDCHTANVGTESLWRVLAGPGGVSVHPDALVTCLPAGGGWSRRSPRPSRTKAQVSLSAESAGSGVGTSRCPGSPASAPAGFPGCSGRPCSGGLGAGPVPPSTRPG